ncbi:hypothetical protein PDESU_05743 [Pontiella desulfatans]|uniref:Uncharacterized protein n=1 Tax=Pontiella desulfatans TaxID=2750659 RepID=A0A6C2UAL3_PONDE|nr:hypothetical protein [Pontiella desulfatans]VGO17148.1 hypothetical protein PDESU_05743 [Pontiella desulfatans]
MEALQTLSPMTWIILIVAIAISIAVLFNKAIKATMKLAVIAVMALLVIYFLQQAGLFQPATTGN